MGNQIFQVINTQYLNKYLLDAIDKILKYCYTIWIHFWYQNQLFFKREGINRTDLS